MKRDGAHWANRYARALACDLGWQGRLPSITADHPSVAWWRSGLGNVTGLADGPCLPGPPGLTAAADGAAGLFASMTGLAAGSLPPGSALLGERARRTLRSRRGQTSPGGSCRLLAARDGWMAVNLARPEDFAMVPAWLETEAEGWDAVEQVIPECSACELLARGRMLGLAVAGIDEAVPPGWCMTRFGAARAPCARAPVVVDLSALWAGPLAGALLAAAGARVIKVEFAGRPDGARAGDADFFNRLNGEKASVVLPVGDPGGVAVLLRLIESADIVLESARPRGLRQMGLVAEEILSSRADLTWISITGYGRCCGAEARIGFGDDTAIAGGVARAMARRYGMELFAGDAVADPLTGLHAACAAWAAWQQGGGTMVALSLAGIVARCLAAGEDADWGMPAGMDVGGLYEMPKIRRAAPPAGAHNVDYFAVRAA